MPMPAALLTQKKTRSRRFTINPLSKRNFNASRLSLSPEDFPEWKSWKTGTPRGCRLCDTPFWLDRFQTRQRITFALHKRERREHETGFMWAGNGCILTGWYEARDIRKKRLKFWFVQLRGSFAIKESQPLTANVKLVMNNFTTHIVW